MGLKSILSRSAIVVGVLIGIFVLFTLRQWNTDYSRPTPRTVEIPDAIRQKFATPPEKSGRLKPIAAIEHGGSIRSVAFSPADASLVASTAWIKGTPQTVKLWNLNDTSEPVSVLKGNTFAFSPDGKLLAISGGWEDIKLWRVDEEKSIATFGRNFDEITFSPDGQRIASGRFGVKLWDIRTPTSIREETTLPLEGLVEKLAFSPDGKFLAAANEISDDVTIWDVERKQIVKTLKSDTQRIEAIKFSSDVENPRFALADSEKNIRLYTLPDWDLHTTIDTIASIYDLVFTPDGKMLLSAGTNEVEFWSIESGKRTALLEGYSPWATVVAFSTDGTTFASGGSDGVLRVWSTSQYMNPQESISQDIVRLIYFLPSDRAARPDVTEKLDQLISETQQFYANQMEHHGGNRKTFTFEKNEDGSAKVYLVEGQYVDKYYLKETFGKIKKEINERFNRSRDVHLIAVDISNEKINTHQKNVIGVGGITPFRLDHKKDLWGAQAGSVIVPASGSGFNWKTIAHELGHAFGLEHDFRDPSYLMSYGKTKSRLSECSAKWLDKSRYFNPEPPFFNAPATIEMAASPVTPSQSKVLRFHLEDIDGLHQAMLLVPPTADTPPPGYQPSKNTEDNKKKWKKRIKEKSFVLHDYRSLNAQKTATVEFNLPEPSQDSVELQMIDVHGNITLRTFNLNEISATK